MGDEAPMNMPIEATVHHTAPGRHTSDTPSVNTATGSDHPEVIEAEVNPLMVHLAGEGAAAVDAVVTVGGESA